MTKYYQFICKKVEKGKERVSTDAERERERETSIRSYNSQGMGRRNNA